MKRLSRLASLAPLILAIVAGAPLAGAYDPAKFLAIHSGSHDTLADGTLLAHYRLRFGEENLAAYCQDMRVFWRPGSIFQPGKNWFALPTRCDADSCDVEIHTSGMVFFTILAEARCGNTLYQAQTIDGLHAIDTITSVPGRAWPVAGDEPVPVAPWLELLPAPSHYYPQTGMTFFFHCQRSSNDIEITSSDAASLINTEAMTGGDFSFTPSHDAALNRLGSEAASERIVVVGEKPNGPVSAFTLNVHRARYAFLDPKSGMVLFLGVAAFSAALVFSLKKQSWRR